jgi:NifB/MoaA-like Fe-S oxidoreductase
MVPLFMKEADRVVHRSKQLGSFRATVVTGLSSFGFVRDFLQRLSVKCGADLVPISIENRLFGANVTVSGLVVGNDIIAAMNGLNIGSCLVVPDVMLKEGQELFLDDVSLYELEQRIGRPVIVFDSTPDGFYKLLCSLSKSTKKIKR